MSGIRSWISATSSLATDVIIAKVRIHSPEAGSFQFAQMTTNPERSAALHGDGVRLLGFLPFDGLPFEEAVHWNNAAPPPTLSIKPRRLRGFFSEPQCAER